MGIVSQGELIKELFGHTKFMRKMLKSVRYVQNGITEIICPCTQKELCKLVDFLIEGKIDYEDQKESTKVFENLNKILGFSEDLKSSDNFSLELQKDHEDQKILNEPLEITPYDTAFEVPITGRDS